MKKLLFTLLILVIIGLFGFFFIAAKIVDGEQNVLLRIDHGKPSSEVKSIHSSLIIADWHSDNLLWDRDPLKRLGHGHVDIPRLIEGNVTLQVFDAVIKSPKGQNYYRNSGDTDQLTLLMVANRWPQRTWNGLFERAIYQSRILHNAAERSQGKLRIIKNQSELSSLLEDRSLNKEMVGGILAIEGLHALENDLENLQKLYDAGYRIMGLTHFFDNEVGGSSAGMEQGGITDLGRKVIHQMNAQSIIIDLAHASEKLIDDVLEISSKPIVVSHTGVKGTFESPRNLSDKHLIEIAKRGGVIGIGFWDGAVGSPNPQDIVKAMRYCVDLIGIDHVSLGSDWDGSTTVAIDAAHIWVLTKTLLEDGFTQDEIEKIMGGNQVRFLNEHLPEL